MKKKVYFDLCALKRVFDDQSQIQIALETAAMMGLLKLINQNKINLVNSDILVIENNKNPNPLRKEFTKRLLSLTNEYISYCKEIVQRANYFKERKIHLLDALHLSYAESSKANYFCTCDEKLYRNANRLSLNIKIIKPIELLQELLSEASN